MSEILNKAAETAASAIMRFKAKTAGRYYPGYHEDMREAVKKAILEADVAADPDFTEELDRLREENERLSTALGDLMTWFPEKPSDPEWRLKAGEYGADDAVEAARAALSPSQPEKEG